MKIFLGSDHAGYELKEQLKVFLLKKGFEIVDQGAHAFDPDDDYPDFCGKAAQGVAHEKEAKGFVFGKSGTGELIAANKVRGVRCALAVNHENVVLSRTHNDCNMLSFGSAFATLPQMKELALLFLQTSFSGDARHVRRIAKITDIENYA